MQGVAVTVMTLIACVHPADCRALISDVLLSSAEGSSDFTSPTRAYLAPEWLRQAPRRPLSFIRKVIELNPSIAILWAGEYGRAVELAQRAREWFAREEASEQSVIRFLNTYYYVPVRDMSAILASSREGWIYFIGPVIQNVSPLFGTYFAAGTGVELFSALAKQMPPRTDGMKAPDVDALRLSSEFMAREITFGETLQSQFGAGYEVLYAGLNGFERVDDVMHLFARITVVGSEVREIARYQHVIRQWYEADRLYIASMSTSEAEAAGLGFKAFVAPDILGTREDSIRFYQLPTRPNYLCIHHVFVIGENVVPSVLTMRGDAIDMMVTISQAEASMTITFSPDYDALLRQQIESAVQAIREGKQPPSYTARL